MSRVTPRTLAIVLAFPGPPNFGLNPIVIDSAEGRTDWSGGVDTA